MPGLVDIPPPPNSSSVSIQDFWEEKGGDCSQDVKINNNDKIILK